MVLDFFLFRSVKIWKVSTGIRYNIELQTKLKAHTSSVMCVKFSPDTKYIASTGGDKLVYVYELSSGKVLQKLDHHTSYVGACAFSRSGKYLVTGSNDKKIAVLKMQVNVDDGPVGDTSMDTHALETNNAYTSSNNTTRNNSEEASTEIEDSHASILHDKEDISLVHVIPLAHGSDINDLVFISSQRLISVSSDKTLRLWPTNEKVDHALKTIIPHSQPMYSVCTNGWCESTTIATTALDGSIGLWDTRTLDPILPAFKTTTKLGIRMCRASDDGKMFITAGDDDGAFVWSFETGACEKELFRGGHSNTVFMACLLKNGVLAVTGCNDGYLMIWDVCKEKVISSIEEAHDLGVVCGAVKPSMDNDIAQCYSILASGGNDGLIKIWKVFDSSEMFGKYEYVQELAGHGSTIMSLCFSPKSGKLMVSTSGDKTARLWNSDSFQCLRVLEGI